MKYLMWLLKAAIFFTLFAFALNNQQDVDRAFLLRHAVARAAGAGGAGRLRAGPGDRRAGHGAALVEAPRRGRAARTRAWRCRKPPASRARRRTMDFDLSWVLWGLPIAFVLGWLASRLDLRQLRIENRQAPKAYFRGLNFLLNEQQDQAIDAFIEAVQNDPDTSELHFALGNLFRRRGEYERAVRVHEHLLSRGDLSRADRHRAQHALALDFLKAGLLDRAEEALRKLEGTRLRGPGAAGAAGDLRALARLGPGVGDRAQARRLGPGQLQRPAGALPVRAGRQCRRRPQAEQLLRAGHEDRARRRRARASNWRRCSAAPATPQAAFETLSRLAAVGARGHSAGGQAADRGRRRRRPAGAGARDPAAPATSCRPRWTCWTASSRSSPTRRRPATGM